MSRSPHISEIGALVGERARGEMLSALMGGRALTAKELAFAAKITPQTASEHLHKLVGARILKSTNQGRFRYFRLASHSVSQMLENMMVLAAVAKKSPISRDNPLIKARTCYDHLAGILGVAVADALVQKNYIVLNEEGGEVTKEGERFFSDFGIDIANARRQRRTFCRPCLDWSERRPHLAGALGAALAQGCFRLRWVKRVEDSRALIVTAAGLDGLFTTLGIPPNKFFPESAKNHTPGESARLFAG
jgi:DNA-binding transcriptional ArsR family regulator